MPSSSPAAGPIHGEHPAAPHEALEARWVQPKVPARVIARGRRRRLRVPTRGAVALKSGLRSLTVRENGTLVPALLRLSGPDFGDQGGRAPRPTTSAAS